MPLKIKFIKDDDEGILPYCEEEDAEKFYFQQILTARFSWGSNKSRTESYTINKFVWKALGMSLNLGPVRTQGFQIRQ